MTDLVGGLDKGSTDVMVADNPELEGQAGFLGIADRCRHTRVGDRHNDVGIDRTLAGKLLPDAFPRLVDAPPLYDAVRAGEIYVLEDAETGVPIVERPQAPDAARADDDDLSRFNVADELGADDV